MKMPPIEKIPEAYTAVIDNRVTIIDNSAKVLSSDYKKEYKIKWKENLYYSNDNSTYWQGYLGYPIIAVLFMNNKLSLNKDIASFFSKVNWNELNKNNKRDYKKSVEDIIGNLSNKKEIYEEINKVYKELGSLDIKLTRKESEV